MPNVTDWIETYRTAQKAAMDAVWTAWIPDDGWPQRACIEVGLSPGPMVEIVVLAAKG